MTTWGGFSCLTGCGPLRGVVGCPRCYRVGKGRRNKGVTARTNTGSAVVGYISAARRGRPHIVWWMMDLTWPCTKRKKKHRVVTVMRTRWISRVVALILNLSVRISQSFSSVFLPQQISISRFYSQPNRAYTMDDGLKLPASELYLYVSMYS
jgi:hypothetical protein